MGLDMYIHKNGKKKNQLCYWRSAHYIHKWFNNNIQGGVDNCKKHVITIEQIINLRDICAKVTEERVLAEKFLPITSVFFFGSTDICKGCFGDANYTARILNDVIEQHTSDDTYSYYADW